MANSIKAGSILFLSFLHITNAGSEIDISGSQIANQGIHIFERFDKDENCIL
jgi:hypothetical protein